MSITITRAQLTNIVAAAVSAAISAITEPLAAAPLPAAPLPAAAAPYDGTKPKKSVLSTVAPAPRTKPRVYSEQINKICTPENHGANVFIDKTAVLCRHGRVSNEHEHQTRVAVGRRHPLFIYCRDGVKGFIDPEGIVHSSVYAASVALLTKAAGYDHLFYEGNDGHIYSISKLLG